MASPLPEIAVGYSLFAGLVVLAINLIRRTREIDRRRDDLADAEMEIAREHELRVLAERAEALAEIEKLRAELWRARKELSDRDDDTREPRAE